MTSCYLLYFLMLPFYFACRLADRTMIEGMSSTWSSIACACCLNWPTCQRGEFIRRPKLFRTCGACGLFVCDACRLALLRYSRKKWGNAVEWGICCGHNALNEGGWHAFEPVTNLQMSEMAMAMHFVPVLYCTSCKFDAMIKESEGPTYRRASYPYKMTYGDWLTHQFGCPHMNWVCPSRCGFISSKTSVELHILNSDCSTISTTVVPERGSLWAELRLLPLVTRDIERVPMASLFMGQCAAVRDSLPMMHISQHESSGEAYMNVSTCSPPMLPLNVVLRVEVWPVSAATYRPDKEERRLDMAENWGNCAEASVKAHRVQIDNAGHRVYAMESHVHSMECRDAMLDRIHLFPNYWDDLRDGTHRPVRSFLVRAIIPSNSQVR